MKRLLLMFTVALMGSLPAAAGEAPTVITFANGTAVTFTPDDSLPNGTTLYHATSMGKPVAVENFDGKNLSADPTGDFGCFDLAYDTKTDLLFCSARNGYQGWYVDYYRGDKQRLKLVRSEQHDLDDPDTDADEDGSKILYESKS